MPSGFAACPDWWAIFDESAAVFSLLEKGKWRFSSEEASLYLVQIHVPAPLHD